MPKYRTGPVALEDIWRDGPAVRVRDLIAITGLSPDTIRADIVSGDLVATKRPGPTSPYLITRPNARAWLRQLGFRAATETPGLSGTAGTRPVLPAGIYQDLPLLVQALVEMGLGSIIRNALKTAQTVTGGSDGLQAEIQIAAWTGQDGYGPTYASAKRYTALVERRQIPVRVASGEVLLSQARIVILQPLKAQGSANRTEPIDLRDKITLPDGTVTRILDVRGVVDPTTDRPFAHEVLCA